MQQSYYKIIGANNFGKYPYKLGLNKLSDNNGEEFNTDPVCAPGGLYYCEAKYIFNYISYGSTVCRVTIPPEARVVAVKNKFKADQINIEEMLELKDPSTFELLIKAGADIHIDNGNVLKWAGQNGYLEIVDLLFKYGAEVHAREDSSLRWASANGHSKVVKLLLENGADIHACNDYALRWASANGHSEVVRILVENGANIHARLNWALQWASAEGHIDVVKILIENGADVHACDNVALRWAKVNHRDDIVELLSLINT